MGTARRDVRRRRSSQLRPDPADEERGGRRTRRRADLRDLRRGALAGPDPERSGARLRRPQPGRPDLRHPHLCDAGRRRLHPDERRRLTDRMAQAGRSRTHRRPHQHVGREPADRDQQLEIRQAFPGAGRALRLGAPHHRPGCCPGGAEHDHLRLRLRRHARTDLRDPCRGAHARHAGRTRGRHVDRPGQHHAAPHGQACARSVGHLQLRRKRETHRHRSRQQRERRRRCRAREGRPDHAHRATEDPRGAGGEPRGVNRQHRGQAGPVRHLVGPGHATKKLRDAEPSCREYDRLFLIFDSCASCNAEVVRSDVAMLARSDR